MAKIKTEVSKNEETKGVTYIEDAKEVTVEEAVEASKTAAEAKAKYDAEVAAQAAAHKGKQVNSDQILKTVGESKDLITAVKEDAEKRGKTFSVCPISGVLVVG